MILPSTLDEKYQSMVQRKSIDRISKEDIERFSSLT